MFDWYNCPTDKRHRYRMWHLACYLNVFGVVVVYFSEYMKLN